MMKPFKGIDRMPQLSQENLEGKIEVIGRRYFVAKAKVESNYRPEYFGPVSEAYKDVLIIFGIQEDKL